MAIFQVPATEVHVDVNTGTSGAPTWTEIKGLLTVTFTESEQEIDTTTMDSVDNDEHAIIRRGKELALDGRYLRDDTTNARDPGQAKVEGYAKLTKRAAEGEFRLRWPDGENEKFIGTVRGGSIGGGHNDMVSWAYTVKRTGASTMAPTP